SPEEMTDPQPAHPDRRDEIHPTHDQTVGMEGGHDQPVHVQDVHDEQQSSKSGERRDMLLHRSEEQEEKGQKEVKQGDRRDDDLPRSGDPMQIPIELVREIAGINDEQLAEGDVGPEQNKGKQQISEMVIMSLV